MEEFKVGGKITLEDDESYRIVDIVQELDKTYLFCSTIEKPITPILLEKKVIDGNIFVRKEEDLEILEKISKKIINAYGNNKNIK